MRAEELRKSLLQQAIQGKLVKQNPADEPASVLLERIRAEKDRLVAEGKLKKDKNSSHIFQGDDGHYYEKIGKATPVDITDDLPFEIPENWTWVRLGYLIKIISGVSYDKKDVGHGTIRILRGGNINALKVTAQPDDVFLPSQYFDEEKQVRQNDIVIVASTGSTTVIGKAGYIDEGWNNTQIGAFLRIIRPLFFEITDWVKFIFATEYYREHIRTLAKGTNINNVKAEYIQNLLFPLPPLAEQERIVKRIEELMPLVDEYARLEANDKALDDNLPTVLKKSILQQAIQGKLVEQDENDEPASVLLERIRTEKKAQLGKKYVESYIYKDDDSCYYEKVGPTVKNISDEIPFDIPDSWSYSKLKNLVNISTGKKDANFGSATGIYDFFTCALEPIKSETYSYDGEYIILPGNGANVGYSILYKGKFEAYQRTYLLKSISELLNFEYLHVVLKALWKDYNQDKQYGSAIPYIKLGNLEEFLVPIPPLAEQKRIVEKLNEILSKL